MCIESEAVTWVEERGSKGAMVKRWGAQRLVLRVNKPKKSSTHSAPTRSVD